MGINESFKMCERDSSVLWQSLGTTVVGTFIVTSIASGLLEEIHHLGLNQGFLGLGIVLDYDIGFFFFLDMHEVFGLSDSKVEISGTEFPGWPKWGSKSSEAGMEVEVV
ncbi:Hypothetical predicted protein [Olea europaea subsp. europaea]|uniref:Uncharacterized protein n=1 Tax=Olea europaea subsp. europaea TaxID=158383 RepID=A0A8S0Q3Z1_OLEEU|nr:Hypothetical predicted protein [Olea europaea subsp. europaea]